ncbi:YchJ family protein [sulfur-oxidizing endosymbiont of Gigantopelta aegis]|uniref:YchJ family protein n=1 Tax=sulfur-oxidizing endosymbiont of Gigantopelta aegis TaxID=2794934 RepID=UPI0018DDE413|nr:YchJ family metal-binding protein [sulfur-oxidizing endosymbiont of Gigantopelta aegis]
MARLANPSSNKANLADCPCQSGLLFQNCCQPFLDTTAEHIPESAEQLMRSRYCAYVVQDESYLLNTWHPKTRPAILDLDTSVDKWIGLKILGSELGQKADNTGTVHFIARFKSNGKAHKLEENSQFEKIDGRWFYRQAIILK